MNIFKRMFSALLALTLCVLAFAGSAGASGGEMYLTADRSGDTVTVRLMTGTTVNFGGISGSISYDRNAFELVKGKSNYLDFSYNSNSMLFAADTGEDLTVDRGETLIVFTFRTKDAFDAANRYYFSVDLISAYNFDLDEYPWSQGAHLSAYIGTGNTPRPTAAPTPKPTSAPIYTNTPRPISTPIYTNTPRPTAAPTSKPITTTTPHPGVTSAPSSKPTALSPAATAAPSPSMPTNTPKITGSVISSVMPTSVESVSTDTPSEPVDSGVTHSLVYTDSNGNVLYIETVSDGETALAPDLPDGCDAWIVNGEKFDFNTPIHSDITITAAAVSHEPASTEEQESSQPTDGTNPIGSDPDALPDSSEDGNDEEGNAKGNGSLTVLILIGAAVIAAAAAVIAALIKKNRSKK